MTSTLSPSALADLPLAMASSSSGSGGNPIMGLLPLIMVMVIFYLLILRPQQRRQKQHQEMVKALQRGDRILTNGGLFATIVDVKDDFFVATISDGVKVEIARSAVAGKTDKKAK